MKANCYKCIHRGTVPGDAHSCCKHPKLVGTQDLFQQLMGLVGRTERGSDAEEELGIRANEHGRKNGWFYFPFNFDPCWLEACNGMTEKTESTA